jgi:hypothetical protein
MSNSNPTLSKDEFLALIDQKAADWRAITQMSTAFLAFAGALFAAGVGQRAAFVVVLTPIPLLFGVFHMAQNAVIQLEMITYLAVFSPFEPPTWEHDVAKVRPILWSESPKSDLTATTDGDGKKKKLAEVRRAIANPSAWHVWLGMGLIIGVIVDFVPLLARGYHSAGLALGLGLLILFSGSTFVGRRAAKIEPTRERWTQQWIEYRDELAAAPDASAAPGKGSA